MSNQNNKVTCPLNCSFCGHGHQESLILIAGPMVNICDECVDLCTQIVSEERSKNSPKPPDETL